MEMLSIIQHSMHSQKCLNALIFTFDIFTLVKWVAPSNYTIKIIRVAFHLRSVKISPPFNVMAHTQPSSCRFFVVVLNEEILRETCVG